MGPGNKFAWLPSLTYNMTVDFCIWYPSEFTTVSCVSVSRQKTPKKKKKTKRRTKESLEENVWWVPASPQVRRPGVIFWLRATLKEHFAEPAAAPESWRLGLHSRHLVSGTLLREPLNGTILKFIFMLMLMLMMMIIWRWKNRLRWPCSWPCQCQCGIAWFQGTLFLPCPNANWPNVKATQIHHQASDSTDEVAEKYWMNFKYDGNIGNKEWWEFLAMTGRWLQWN